MITSGPGWLSRNQMVISGLMVSLLLVAMLVLFAWAPEEGESNEVQRIAYLYVSVAWCGVGAFVFVGAVGAIYLVRRNLSWDHWSQAAAETGWLCTTLTLITGVMWAHETGNTWWTWDPRLLVALVMWLIYGGYFLLRAGLGEPQRRARMSAVLGVLGIVDIPLVVASTRWFWGIAPEAVETPPHVRLVLLVSVLGFTAFFAFLTMQRRWQLGLEQQVAALEWRIGVTSRLSGPDDAPASPL
ncbi:MAG: cytochrome c biogenesis protein CcsA [Planctomycetota bacterium]|nr:cytochrome c biogenesis protein CcsA [Planctomycetota bacterium]